MSLYAKGMTTCEIVATFKEMYDADVSPTLIFKVIDAVKEQVTEWQNRPLDALYPIVYLNCIVVKARHSGSVINKAVFLALGINKEGQKELLGTFAIQQQYAKIAGQDQPEKWEAVLKRTVDAIFIRRRWKCCCDTQIPRRVLHKEYIKESA